MHSTKSREFLAVDQVVTLHRINRARTLLPAPPSFLVIHRTVFIVRKLIENDPRGITEKQEYLLLECVQSTIVWYAQTRKRRRIYLHRVKEVLGNFFIWCDRERIETFVKMETVIQQKVIEVANQVEKQLDAELEKLDNLDINDFEKLRETRLKQLKKLQQQKQNWLSQGHGEHTELSDEKEFFDVSKKSENIVCLFYKDDSPRSKIADHHLKILAKKHIEAKFCKLNVERCPFLTERLRIRIIPTIALVVNGKTKDYIVGFTDLDAAKKPWLSNISKKKTIKGGESDDSDDD
ncbi:hypothetical protein KM043_014939 [Ampulex compressa]|nr:hypothetical protein KM043_014939 [Ampulex compressa]